MASTDALESVAAQLRAATSFVALFGVLPKTDKVAQGVALRKQFNFLARLVHPDYYSGNGLEARATEVFRQLNDFRRRAEDAIESGTYEKSFSAGMSSDALTGGSSKAESEIRSGLHTYHLAPTPFKTGDFSVTYRGRIVDGPGGDVLVKIASQPSLNGWFETESGILSRFRDAQASNKLSGIKNFIPHLVESFLMPGPKGTRYAVNITRFVPDLVSVADIMKAYPKGLDPRDAAWIFRRIVAQAIAADMAGVVHTAITPDHVLLDPFKREPLHIGWAHALEDPKHTHRRVTHVIDRWKALYPPEVFKKEEPDHRTDLFMVGQTMIALLGGDVSRSAIPSAVPYTVAQVIMKSVEKAPKNRFQTGKQLLDEFTRVIRKEWGREYRPLVMPN